MTVASVTTETCIGMFGARIEPDCSVDDAEAKSYDAVVVVGGAGTQVLKQYPQVLQILRDAKEQDKILAAICLGPIVLAKAGVLKGKKSTVFSSGVAEVEEGGAQYVPKPVVIDGNLITTDGPNSATRFGNAIVRALS